MDAAATGCSVLDLFDATSDAAALEAQPEGDAEGPVVPRERGALGHVGDGREERDAGLGEDAAEGGEGHVDLPHASVTIFIVFAVKISRNRHGCRTLT